PRNCTPGPRPPKDRNRRSFSSVVLSFRAPAMPFCSFERFEPLVEVFLVLLNRLGGTDQLDVIRVLVAIDLQGEHAVAGPIGRLVRSRHAVAESAVDVEIGGGEPTHLRLLDGCDVVDGLALRRDELSLPAVDVRLDRAADSLEDDQLSV